MVDLVTFSPGHRLNEGGMKTTSKAFKTAPNDWIELEGVAPEAARYANRTGSGYEDLTVSDARGGTFSATIVDIGSPAVTVEPGEASVGSAICATDETRSVDLPTQVSDEPVYLAWNTQATDDIQIGVGADFPDNSWETLELCRVTTNDTTVTNLVDTRPLGMENAISHVGNTSDIQFKRVDSFDDTVSRDEGIIQIVGPERDWMRMGQDGYPEQVRWSTIGTTIEDWEESGGSFPAAWDPYEGHAITGAAALDGGSWGFSNEGVDQQTSSSGGLQAYPKHGSWFEFLIRWDAFPSGNDARIQVQFGANDQDYYLIELRRNHDQTYDEMRLLVTASDISGNTEVTPRSGQPGERFELDTVYRVAAYLGGTTETWHLELYDYTLGGTDRLINSWTGTTDRSHAQGWLGIQGYTYGTDVSIDRLRRPPRDPPQ